MLSDCCRLFWNIATNNTKNSDCLFGAEDSGKGKRGPLKPAHLQPSNDSFFFYVKILYEIEMHVVLMWVMNKLVVL